MNTRKFFIGKTVGSLVVALLVGGFFLFNNYIYQQKQGDGTEIKTYRAILEGEYVCLPYKTNDETTTEPECEPGLKTAVGEYYAVNFYLMSQEQKPLEVGQVFSASGTITPAETLSAEKWSQFEMEGIFSVTDSVVVMGEE
jgi:hypothetical protein